MKMIYLSQKGDLIIKQNIKICVVTIFIMIISILLLFKFVKIDKSCQALIMIEEDSQTINIDNDLSSYIEKKQINNINVLYDHQYYSCNVIYFKKIHGFTKYWIFLPTNIVIEDQYYLTNIVVDSIDLYHLLIVN